MGRTMNLTQLRERARDLVLGEPQSAESWQSLISNIKEQIGKTCECECIELKLLLGEVLLFAEKDSEAASLFSQLLSDDEESIPAMLGLADCHIAEGQLDSAERVLHSALDLARQGEDVAVVLSVADRLAWCAACQEDRADLVAAKKQMCDAIGTMTKIESIPTLTVDFLLESGHGELALDYIDCLVEHKGSAATEGVRRLIVQYATAVYRQAGLSEIDLDRRLSKGEY